jgi:replicative DNA helicase
MTNAVTTKSAARVPPHSLEAEQSVLGALMLDPRAYDRIVDIVTPSDFYHREHQLIFEAMRRLAEQSKPIDVLTLSEALKSEQQLDKVRGEAYLYELAKNTPSSANIAAYADIVRDRSILRQLIMVGTDITENALNADGRDIKELLDTAERHVFTIAEQGATRGTGPQDINSLLAKTTDKIDKLFHCTDPITGVSTGYADFDEMTSGLQAGDLVIVAGRPSMGKTMLGINMAENVAMETKKAVLIFSMEMPAESIVMRMISSLGLIDQHRVRTGKLNDEDWPRVTSTIEMLSQTRVFIDDTPALTPGEVRSRARRVAREQGGLALVLVDYLQLMHVPGIKENRSTEISEISRSLKALAKELNAPVIALSQLNRGLEQRTDKRPVMSDLRESGAIEQDADLIVFIYRDVVYHPDTPDKNKAEIIIAKQRNGPIGKVNLTFRGQYTRFDSYSYEQAPVDAIF